MFVCFPRYAAFLQFGQQPFQEEHLIAFQKTPHGHTVSSIRPIIHRAMQVQVESHAPHRPLIRGQRFIHELTLGLGLGGLGLFPTPLSPTDPTTP